MKKKIEKIYLTNEVHFNICQCFFFTIAYKIYIE